MNTTDIRWKQRFSNYKKALLQLSKAVELNLQRPLSDLEKQGVIQAFEYCHELAWNVLKDFFEYQGKISIMGSRDATREAFNKNLLTDGETWMDMITSRNQSSHTYNEEIANVIAQRIIELYYPLFIALQNRMQELYNVD